MNVDKKSTTSVSVNSVKNALTVLRRLAAADHPEGVSTIARATNVSPSSCFNILKTLVAEDFIQFDSERKTYSLGPAAVDLAVAALDPETGFLRTRKALNQFARDHLVTCGLWRFTNRGRLTLLGAAESEEDVRVRLAVGQRLPMMIGAMGRCVAVHLNLSDEEIERQIATLEWNSRPKTERYLNELKNVRKSGFAIDDGDFLQGITTVAAPILSRDGDLTHCIAATTFTGRRERKALNKLGVEVQETARACAGLLGGIR